MSDQMGLFDSGAARAARDEAIERVYMNAEPDWKVVAHRAVADIPSGREFTTDDIWRALNGAVPHEPRALGAIMQRAAAGRLAVPTDRYVQSERPACHARPIRVWRRL